MSQTQCRLLLPTDQAAIQNFERERLNRGPGDAMDREIAAWSASWRDESLQHYLPNGWCYGVFTDDQLEAYALVQPLLFFRAQMQTLWLEAVSYESESAGHLLLDTIYRWARDKHFQCILANPQSSTSLILKLSTGARRLPEGFIEWKTSRTQ